MPINIYKDQLQKAYLFGTAVLYSEKPIPQADVPPYWTGYELSGTAQNPDRPYALVDQAPHNYVASILSPLTLKKYTAKSRLVKDKFHLTPECLSLTQFCSEYGIPCPQTPLRHMMRPASPDEAGLFYALPPEQDEELGAIGHVRVDFGREGNEFWHTWWPRGPEELNSPEFKEELGEVVNDLRKGVLKDLSTMLKHCQGSEGAIEGGACCQNYGFVLETPRYIYRLRCNPVRGDYQAYLNCFINQTQQMGLTEKGRQMLRDTADPSKAHEYRWYVIENIKDSEHRVDHQVPLMRAIRLYAELDCADKRLGVTKDGIASVDLVIQQDGREWFPEDRLKLDSFSQDQVVAGAVEEIQQALEPQAQDMTMGGDEPVSEQIQVPMPRAEWSGKWQGGRPYSECAAERELHYSAYMEQIRRCISGLTAYAAGQAANHQDAQLPMLRDLVMEMAYFWRLDDGMDCEANKRMDQQYGGGFDRAVAEARQSSRSPELTDQARQDVLTGLEVHVQELSTSEGPADWIQKNSKFAQQLRTEWQMGLEPQQQGVLTITMGGYGLMTDLVQCTVTRRDLQHWLVRGPASLVLQDLDDRPVCPLVKMNQSPGIDYLYHVPLQNGAITWDRAPAFIGVYKLTNGANDTVYLTPEFAGSSICQQAELVSPGWKDRPTMKEEIVQRVGQYIDDVIANDRHNLSVRELTSWSELLEYKNYLAGGAKTDAEEKVFCGNEPDGQFHHGYAMERLPEATFLAYLQSPKDLVKTEAEQYMLINQEDFLLQFLKTEALLTEYRALMEDPDNPLHRMREITQAVKASGAKTVSVNIQRDGKELTFKAEAHSLCGQRSSYNTSYITAPDRRKFEQEFGRFSGYGPEDITKITYGRNTIYEAAPDQTESMAEDLEMGGMTL